MLRSRAEQGSLAESARTEGPKEGGDMMVHPRCTVWGTGPWQPTSGSSPAVETRSTSQQAAVRRSEIDSEQSLNNRYEVIELKKP